MNKDFSAWWNREGKRVCFARPRLGASIAWSNGAYVERNKKLKVVIASKECDGCIYDKEGGPLCGSCTRNFHVDRWTAKPGAKPKA